MSLESFNHAGQPETMERRQSARHRWWECDIHEGLEPYEQRPGRAPPDDPVATLSALLEEAAMPGASSRCRICLRHLSAIEILYFGVSCACCEEDLHRRFQQAILGWPGMTWRSRLARWVRKLARSLEG